MICKVIITERLNVHAKPNFNSEIIKFYYPGDLVNVVRTSLAWAELDEGYCMNIFLEDTNAE